MSASVKALKSAPLQARERCTELLREVADEAPDSVFVLYWKDGKILHRTAFMNRLEAIGAIEVAKQELWST